MTHIAICDDLKEDRQIIKNLINDFCINNKIDFEISSFANGDDLIEFCKNNPVDVIFLDIYLIGESGIDIAKELRRSASNFKLIFTTFSTQHAIDGFEVFAFNYLVKPVKEEKFDSVFSEAIDVVNKEKQNKICIKNGDFYITILHNEIIYIESIVRKINFYTIRNSVITCYSKLDEIERDLNNNKFMRCHKSFIINMDYVEKIASNSFYLKNNHIVPIKQKKYTALRKDYMEYISNKLSLEV